MEVGNNCSKKGGNEEMKKFMLFASLSIILILTACGGASVGEDLIEYQNNFSENVAPKITEVNQILMDSETNEDPEVTYNVAKDGILPIVDEIKSYLHAENPETEEVRGVHEKRVKAFDAYSEAHHLRADAFQKLVEENRDEADDLMKQSSEQMDTFNELKEQFQKEYMKLMKENNVELNGNDNE